MNDKQKRTNFLLKKKISFLTEKIKIYENNKKPVISLLPVNVYDLYPLNVGYTHSHFLMAIIMKEQDMEANVIKITRKILKKICNFEDFIVIQDFIITNNLAERLLINGKWVWKLKKK